MVKNEGGRENERQREGAGDKAREREVLSHLVNSWLMTLIPLRRESSLPPHITCINMYA